jgi:hypothetical protein
MVLGLMESEGVSNHPPFLRLLGSVGPVPAVLTLSVAVLGTAGVLAGPPVGAVGAAGDHPGAGAGLGRVAFAVQLHRHPGAQGRVVLGPARIRSASCPSVRARVGSSPWLRATNTGSRLGVAGWPLR